MTIKEPHRMKPTIYLSDLSGCLPQDALSTTATDHQWQVVDYDAGEMKGRMIAAVAYADPPEVRLPLGLKGWYGISIGFWPGTSNDCRIKYRLSNEDVFTVLHEPFKFEWDRFEMCETFPRYEDLTPVESIVFGKERSFRAIIAYLKLEPLSAEKAIEIQRDRQRTDTRKLIAINDGFGHLYDASAASRAGLREIVAAYRHSDVGMIIWGANGGDLTFYPHTKVGRFLVASDAPSTTNEARLLRENHAALARAGVRNPFEVVMDQCHGMGLEFHLYYRMAICDYPHPISHSPADSFFLQEHPECRMVHKDGTPMPLASYAFPEVRDFMVSLIEEGMEYDIDGVNLCLIRGPEYFGYEQPVVDDFLKRYGEDPRQLPDDDERLRRLRAGYLTEFFRAVRRAADKHGAKRGRKMQVSTYVLPTDELMWHFGYDYDTWLNEGLIDFFLGHSSMKLLAIARKRGCKVYFIGGPPGRSESSIVDQVLLMKHVYASDLDGLALWDVDARMLGAEAWNILGRLGHKEEVLDLINHGSKYPRMKRIKFLAIAGRDVAHTVGRNNPGGFPPEMLPLHSGG